MSLLKNIKNMLGEYRFRRELKTIIREPESISLDEASSIGILYDATDERDSETVKNFMKNIKSTFRKDFLALGYVDKRTMHSSQYAQLSLDYFSNKDLNFMMIPVNPTVSNFINTKFDILININSQKCVPLSYITAVSKARFKVGVFTEVNGNCFDMMVKLPDEPSVKTTLEEIEYFLRLIRKT
jgi:hypothetical protein